jgi:tetratricopeptide (TPR) repeat protein
MDSCQANSPDDVAIARRALAEGDLRHAITHLAAALAVDPLRREWLALLDAALQASDDPLALAPIGGEKPAYFGIVAVHAYALAKLNRAPEAIDVLCQLVLAVPNVPFLEWGLAWVQRPEAAGKLPMGRILWLISTLVQDFPALKQNQDGGRATLDRAAEFIRRVRRSMPADASFLSVSVSLLRRLGRLDEALEYARTAYELSPGYQTAVAVAVAHRSRKAFDASIAAYRDALNFMPDDVAARLDVADIHWDCNRLEEAEAAYAGVLTREPAQPWALPSRLFLSWYRTADEQARFKLLALADACPDNERARRLADEASPYVGYLPEPSDAITNGFKAMLREGKPFSGMTQVTLTSPEAPSNFLAVPSLYQTKVDVVRLHSPDSRRPRRPVKYMLWQYDGLTPRPAVAAPPADVVEAVTKLASQPQYALQSWQRQAARIARDFPADRAGDFLAAMVHPPQVEKAPRPWAWVYRWQVAAALIVSQLEAEWEGSRRREALLSLVWGPVDWTTDAALVALAALAQDEEPRATEVTNVFREVLATLPRGGAVCYYPALLWSMLRLPTLDAEDRADLRRRLLAFHQVPDDEADTCFKYAQIHDKNNEPDKALEQLDRALSINPDHFEALWLRALIHLDGWRIEQSVADLDRVILLSPTFAAAWSVRGDAKSRLLRLDDAVSDYSEALRLKPEEPSALSGRGLMLRLSGRGEEALADYTRLLELQPDRTQAYQMRGRAYAALNRHDEAIADFGRALERDPSLTQCYFDRARSWEAKGNVVRALADFASAIATDPSAKTYNERAKFHYFRKEYAEARADHEAALRLAPDDATTMNHLAWILSTCPDAEVRDGARAVELATRACEVTKWEAAYCVDTLGTACAEVGDFEAAVRHGLRAAELVEEDGRQEYLDRVELYRAGKAFRGE